MLHTVYKALPIEDVERIIAYCQSHTIQNGGLFEVFPGPDGMMKMVVVNSSPEDDFVTSIRIL